MGSALRLRGVAGLRGKVDIDKEISWRPAPAAGPTFPPEAQAASLPNASRNLDRQGSHDSNRALSCTVPARVSESHTFPLADITHLHGGQ